MKYLFQYGYHPHTSGWSIWLTWCNYGVILEFVVRLYYHCSFTLTIGESQRALDANIAGGLTWLQVELQLWYFGIIGVGIPIWWRKKVTRLEQCQKESNG